MIITQELDCEYCDSQFSIELNIEDHPNGAEFCPFCQEPLPHDENLMPVDALMED